MKASVAVISIFILVLTACTNMDQSQQVIMKPTPSATSIVSQSSAPISSSHPLQSEKVTSSQTPAPTSSAATVPEQQKVTIPPDEGTRPDHVVIVVEENHSYETLIGNRAAPYINALTKQGAFFTHSYAVAHPSQPNYFVLFSGSDQGVKDDSCGHLLKTPNLASELVQAGFSFSGYSEDLPGIGSTACTNHQYGRKHSPWGSFSNVAKESNLPFSQFPTDYSKLPTVSFVIPNLDNDMHDGTILSADNWLKTHIGPYVTWAQSHNSLLILTWDEDDSSKDNHIPTIFVGAMVKPVTYDQKITHLNVLRTVEDLYHLPYMGATADASAIQGIWRNKLK
ncbi:alkaline phosphatase family protein [Paenibacillus sp. MAH-36]|uniref:Alkaline phosphatase family protein n=1 Tax=Paenibacillus violae TaxID=3077234 RepID=A0ABU3RPN5_9BACL|nr:alkaline phosphatase family protein [Paenibacillus sp. PFR10]MDU0206056.1 alkaline phosphatase family protein [Paenibacillus sp. PFR10]